VFANKEGSVAAPTAGLHFTPELIHKLESGGVSSAKVNLRIGLDTFRPVMVENIEDHTMHTEYCSVSKNEAEKINNAIEKGKKIVAVGTTSVRTLESFAEGRHLTSGISTQIFLFTRVIPSELLIRLSQTFTCLAQHCLCWFPHLRDMSLSWKHTEQL